MKKWSILAGIALFTAVLSGCSSAYYASTGYAGDDLYVTHDRTAIARRQQQEAEARKAEAEARRAEWEARIAEAQAAAAESQYNGTAGSGSNAYSYSSVLADTYESAYARRLRGFESLSYRMPSSYYNFRYGDAFTYVSAYDPAFYNIVVSGDEVWVEPKYISSMFGTWGATIYTGSWYGSWNYGWRFGSPWWGYPSWGWNWGFAYHPWHDPWFRTGWGPYGYGHVAARPPHNYRLDRYPASGGSNWRGGTTGGNRPNAAGTGSNSGRRTYNNGRGNGSYNNRGTAGRNDFNNSSRPNNTNNANDRNSNYNNSNSNRSGSYNNYNSGRGGFGGSTGGYSGGSSGGGSGRGGGSYNGGR